MDEFDAFYQQLDSEQLLDKLGPQLREEAREILARDPDQRGPEGDQRVGGRIMTADSHEAEAWCRAVAAETGHAIPPQQIVGTCSRSQIEDVLRQRVGTEPWLEEPGQPQTVLPVVVSTRDGIRFGFFRARARLSRHQRARDRRGDCAHDRR